MLLSMSPANTSQYFSNSRYGVHCMAQRMKILLNGAQEQGNFLASLVISDSTVANLEFIILVKTFLKLKA